MRFVALDFETANEQHSSICAVGLAVVEDLQIVERKRWLVRPAELRFKPWNMHQHHITEAHVRDKPKFDALWSEIGPKLIQQVVIAHSAEGVDISMLRQTLDAYGIPYPTLDYLCTVKLARSLWPELPHHGLDDIATKLGVRFVHHDPEEDAVVAAQIGIHACRQTGASTIIQAAQQLDVTAGHLYPGGWVPCSGGHTPKRGVGGAYKYDDDPIETIIAVGESRLDQLLAMLVDDVGKNRAFMLAERFGSMDAIALATQTELAEIDDIGPVAANSVYDFFRSAVGIDAVARLKKVGIDPKVDQRPASQDRRPLLGKTIVVTGTLPSFGRDEVEDLIVKLGGRASNSVSKKTSFVVAGEGAGSKRTKALELGVEVIDEAEFLRRIEARRA
jgi:DNA polymerase III subunit epsilon